MAMEIVAHLPDELLQESAEGAEFRDRLLTTTVTKIQLLRLAMKGLNATEAAKVVGCSPATARMHYASVDFRQEVMRRVDGAFADVDAAYVQKRRSLHDLIEDQAYKSCEDLIGMLDNPDLHPSIRARINQDFLNRVEESSQVSRSLKVEPSDLSQAAKVAQEMDNVVVMRRKG